jgi:hypothetical protein
MLHFGGGAGARGARRRHLHIQVAIVDVLIRHPGEMGHQGEHENRGQEDEPPRAWHKDSHGVSPFRRPSGLMVHRRCTEGKEARGKYSSRGVAVNRTLALGTLVLGRAYQGSAG